MNFEELQNSWKSQPLSMPEDTSALREGVAKKWRKQQRTVLWSNIGVTLGFTMAISVMVWVFVSFHKGRSPMFGISLFMMVTLMLVYLGVLWKGIIVKKMDPTLPGSEYIHRYVAALQWRRKTITTYTWIYCGILWLALMCYYADVLAGASLSYQVGAPVATTVYLFAILLLKRKSRRKQLDILDELISDLKKLEDNDTGGTLA